MTKIIGITGGKGGTGKSTVATAIAYKLSKTKKVLLIDADVDCPNDHLLLNITRKENKKVTQRIPKFDFNKCTQCGKCGKVCKSSAIVSIKDTDPILIKEQCNGCGSCRFICPSNAITWENKEIGQIYSGKKENLDFLGGELKTNEPVSEFIVNTLNENIKEIKSRYDYIVVDTAAGTHCPVIAALEICHSIYSVTEPTPLGEHDLEIILKLIEKLQKKSKIIINRSDIGKEKLIENLAKKFETQILAKIPYSKEIANNYSKGIPIETTQIDTIVKEIMK